MVTRLTPRRYRIATFAALVFLGTIVVSGALVRLTGSGLGCTDWPNCNDAKFVDVSSKHAAIEQINRLFTGAVGASVILAVLGSIVRAPRRRDLTWLSLGLVVGVFGQAVLGAFVVWSDLNPILVQGHFLLSMALMANAWILHRRAGEPDGARSQLVVGAGTSRLGWAITVATGIALIAGTVVTGAGPHSGSVDGEPVERFGLAIPTAARIHSLAVWVALVLAFVLLVLIRNRPGDRRRMELPVTIFLGLGVLQAAVGYIQYFSDVPVPLVAVHIGLATGVWLAALHIGLSSRSVDASQVPTKASELVRVG